MLPSVMLSFSYTSSFHITFPLSFLALNGGKATLAITPSSHFVTTDSLRQAICLIPGA